MADDSQTQNLLTNTMHQATSFPVGLSSYAQNQTGTMSSRRVEKKSSEGRPLRE